MQTDTRQGLQNPDFLGINANLKCYVSHTLSVIRIRSITIKFVNRVRGQSMISPRSYVLINKPQREVSHTISRQPAIGGMLRILLNVRSGSSSLRCHLASRRTHSLSTEQCRIIAALRADITRTCCPQGEH